MFAAQRTSRAALLHTLDPEDSYTKESYLASLPATPPEQRPATLSLPRLSKTCPSKQAVAPSLVPCQAPAAVARRTAPGQLPYAPPIKGTRLTNKGLQLPKKRALLQPHSGASSSSGPVGALIPGSLPGLLPDLRGRSRIAAPAGSKEATQQAGATLRHRLVLRAAEQEARLACASSLTSSGSEPSYFHSAQQSHALPQHSQTAAEQQVCNPR